VGWGWGNLAALVMLFADPQKQFLDLFFLGGGGEDHPVVFFSRCVLFYDKYNTINVCILIYLSQQIN